VASYSYGCNQDKQFAEAAVTSIGFLRSEKQSDPPVQAPTKFELVINLRTAKTLGLTIRQTLLATADEVIE
jgi:putative ABC transport system substrate-binding protein